jgi:hypothetical protein
MPKVSFSVRTAHCSCSSPQHTAVSPTLIDSCTAPDQPFCPLHAHSMSLFSKDVSSVIQTKAPRARLSRRFLTSSALARCTNVGPDEATSQACPQAQNPGVEVTPCWEPSLATVKRVVSSLVRTRHTVVDLALIGTCARRKRGTTQSSKSPLRYPFLERWVLGSRTKWVARRRFAATAGKQSLQSFRLEMECRFLRGPARASRGARGDLAEAQVCDDLGYFGMPRLVERLDVRCTVLGRLIL